MPKCTFTYETPATGPALAVKDGSTKLTSPYAYNFGLATAGTEKTFTLSNPGTQSITVNIAATNGFGVSPASATIAAKGETTLTITMADATATGAVTITPTATSVDAFTIKVSGTIRDMSKIFEDFSGNALPDGWTTAGIGSYTTGSYASSYVWNFANGYAKYISSTSTSTSLDNYKHSLVTPELIISSGGETMLFKMKKDVQYSSYLSYLLVQHSANGTDWTDVAEGAFEDAAFTGEWQSESVTIPETAKYVRFVACGVDIDEIYGGTLYVPTGAKFAIDPTNATQNLGLTAIGGNLEKTFTVSNAGNEDLTVTFTAPTGFDVVGKATTFILTDNFGWGSAKVYAWDANQNPLNGAWPGNVDAEIITNDFSEKQFKVVVPNGAVGVIVNNGNGAQTENITNFSSYEGFWMDGTKDSDGHYKVTGWGTYSNPAISSLTVPAGESKSFTVKMNTATAGAKSGTLSLALSDNVLDATSPYEINLSGVVMPADATVVDFNDGKLPENWTSTGTWNFANGEAGATSAATMTTTAVEVSDGDFLVLKVRNYGNFNDDYVQVEAYDGSNWSVVKKIMSTDFYSSTEYTSLVVTIPTTTQKLRFTAYYAYIDEIVGINYASVPVLKMTSDAEGNTELAANTTCDLGWNTADASYTYYIKNAGTATLNISEITAPTGITAATAGNATTVAPDATLALTVTMAVENNFGAHTGTVTITTDGGNYEIPVSGVVIEDGKLYLDFSADGAAFPTGWSTGSWNITGGTAVASGTLQTTKLTAAAGEEIIIEAISTGSYYSTASLSYTYSIDNGTTWQTATDLTSQLNTSTYTIIPLGVIDPDDDTDVLVKFTGSNVSVRRIYGFTAAKVAVMETTAANIAFGMQTAESAEQSFTISNTGEAALTGLSVSLAKTSAEAEYSVRMTNSDDSEFTGTELAAGATINVYVKQLFDVNNVGAKSDVLTIAADGQTTKTINLTGATRDPSILYVDFDEPNAFPEGWQAGTNWSVYTFGTDRYAYQSSSSTASALVTTPLTVEDGQSLSFKVSKYGNGDKSLKVRYSQNGGATWGEYVSYPKEGDIDSGWKLIEIDDLPTGNLLIEFFGTNIKLDMIQGLKLATAPALALTESDAAVENGSTKAFENLKAEGTATYTLKNIGNAAMTSTVAITGGATVAISGEGEGVTISDKTVTLAAGKSATITLTVPFEAPYDDMSGAMTITTEGWVGDFAVNYTATLVDPTDFVEDFAAGQPAGWYSEGWSYTGGVASVNAGVEKPMITELIGAEDGKNTLSFDAKVYSGDEDQTLNVYTSADRKSWSAAQSFTVTSTEQTFSLAALADGEYYVKFEAANVAIDNVKGVKRIIPAPAHDLYEISNTISNVTTGVPGAEFTATVTAISLIADESDIVAELWLKKSDNSAHHNVARLENQTLTANTSKTFTLTGNLPDWAEGSDYKMYATVKKSDDAAYFNTDDVDFTLEQNLQLTINSFAVTTPAVQADDNNEYTATFNISVTNSSSRDLNADEVSVSLVNNTSSNPDVVFTSTWTLANSQTVFLNPGDYTTGAKMAIYRWNDTDTDEQKEWDLFTEISTGFYSAELNGKKNFIICRVNPETAKADLAWDANVYNQSGNLTTAAGNIFSNNGYNSNILVLTVNTMSTLAKGVSTTLQVTATGTLTDGENANITFYARENLKNDILDDGITYTSATAAITAAPVIELDETVGTVASQGQNRKVSLKHSFAEGWNTICLPFAINATDIHTEAKALAFTAYDSSTKELTFSPVTELEANKPYVIYVPEVLAGPFSFSGKTVATNDDPETAFNGVTFQGTYAPMAAGSLENKWGLTAKGKIAKAGESTTMKGFRAYFDGIPANSSVRFIDFDDETTGIIAIEDAQKSSDDTIYNLNGQRVQSVKKGSLYIVNGKKTVVK